MKKEVNPKETSRAQAYELWMKAPNPMVTFFKTIDVTRIVKVSKKRELKFNMLLDWCIGRAASSVKEFYLLPVGDKLMRYDSIAVNTIVKNAEGEVSSTTRRWTVPMPGGFWPICKKKSTNCFSRAFEHLQEAGLVWWISIGCSTALARGAVRPCSSLL